jgi:hypothetical protein
MIVSFPSGSRSLGEEGAMSPTVGTGLVSFAGIDLKEASSPPAGWLCGLLS